MAKRLMEIDALRGLAVGLMVLYHLAFDGWFMEVWNLNMGQWWIEAGGMFVRFTFLILVGVSVVLSSRDFKGQLKRGALVFAGGMLMTLGSFIFVRDYTIWFGILHMIGVSIPIVYLFKGRPWLASFMALLIVALFIMINGAMLDTPWLVWLGFPYLGFASLDYFPLIPWLALPLFGISIGHWVYGKRKPTPLKLLAEVPGLTWMGQRAFAIYLIHQPVIISVLWLYKLI